MQQSLCWSFILFLSFVMGCGTSATTTEIDTRASSATAIFGRIEVNGTNEKSSFRLKHTAFDAGEIPQGTLGSMFSRLSTCQTDEAGYFLCEISPGSYFLRVIDGIDLADIKNYQGRSFTAAHGVHTLTIEPGKRNYLGTMDVRYDESWKTGNTSGAFAYFISIAGMEEAIARLSLDKRPGEIVNARWQRWKRTCAGMMTCTWEASR